MDLKFVDLGKTGKIPTVGFGTWNPQPGNSHELETGLNAALEAGYRHIDTAYMYKNEAIIGNVLKKWIDSGKLNRSDLFITSKLPPHGVNENYVRKFVDESLRLLQLDYIDLYLIHNPMGMQFYSMEDAFPVKNGKLAADFKTDLISVWKALEKEVDSGKLRAIGLSNCNSKQIETIYESARIPPCNLQVEMHLYLQQKDLRKFCKERDISVTAYAPLGTPNSKPFLESTLRQKKEYFTPLLQDKVVLELATKYEKTPGQVLLRFLVQNGVAVIPKSGNPKRILENIQIFDFILSDADMKALGKLDQGSKGRRFDFSRWEGLENHPQNPHISTILF